MWLLVQVLLLVLYNFVDVKANQRTAKLLVLPPLVIGYEDLYDEVQLSDVPTLDEYEGSERDVSDDNEPDELKTESKDNRQIKLSMVKKKRKNKLNPQQKNKQPIIINSKYLK